MSKYTTTLRNVINIYGREVVESWFTDYELSDYMTQEEIDVINARGIFTKEKLAKQIVDHYFMREIGLETPALFRHEAKVLMREIMESKLPLIYSAAIKYDPLINVDYKEIYEGEHSSDGNSTTSSSGLTVNSDSPQGQINKTQILEGKYASSTGAVENTDTTEAGSTGSDSYTKHIIGNSGVSATAQRMVQQYRDNIITINRDIINEVNVLFMGVY